MAYNEMIRLTGKTGAVYEFAIGAGDRGGFGPGLRPKLQRALNGFKRGGFCAMERR